MLEVGLRETRVFRAEQNLQFGEIKINGANFDKLGCLPCVIYVTVVGLIVMYVIDTLK